MTQKNLFIYKNVILQGSFQTAGHVDEYFIQRTRHLIILYSLPRMQNHTNDIYLYEKGKLIKVIHKSGSPNPLFYYFNWLLSYWHVLMILCKKEEDWIVFAGHPVFFFFMSLQKALRNIRFAYWVGDYFPEKNWKTRLYEKIKKHYHDTIPITYYLSDRINSRMNGGTIQNTIYRKTVAWGMKSHGVKKKSIQSRWLAFIGVIKPSQNIEAILEYLHKDTLWKVKLIGVCEHDYYQKLKGIISQYSLEKRVWFPNKFVSESRLNDALKDCLVGLALYKSGKSQFTWYTDPGKVKTYLEFGLPVIMTDTSSIANDVIKFHCGEIIKGRPLVYYIRKVIENYPFYQKGVRGIILHYEYSGYYNNQFVALRSV